MKIESIDHLVITVSDVNRSINFYINVLGMDKQVFEDGRVALSFGDQKINLHQYGEEIEPNALNASIGSADVCLVTLLPIERVVEHLLIHGVDIIKGPVERRGSRGTMSSVYFRDPDGNLLEVSHYPEIGFAEED